MRPLKLIMTAFGPYAREQVIDFTELKGRNLFLITGPTGAGKTTIFDGICFALFNKASGEDRDGQSMRSHFADEGTLTSVELEFELRGKRYWIRRVPKQAKRKSRGDGFTDHGPEAEFREITERSITLSGIREVDEKIVETLGISYEQFKQIIMVPQGEFRKLITTDSKEREDILQKIFGTEGFRLIQEKLSERAKTLEQEVKTLKSQQEQNIHNIDCTAYPELAATLMKSPYHVPEIVDQLKKALILDGNQESQLNEAVKTNEKLAEIKQKEIFQAHENNKKFMAKDEAEINKNNLESRQVEIEQKKEILQQARKALGLKGVEENCQSCVVKVSREQNKLSETVKRESAFLEEMQAAEKHYNQEVTREVERNRLLTEQTRLQGLNEKVVDLETRQAELLDLEKNLSVVTKTLSDAKLQIEQEKRSIKNSQSDLEAAKDAGTEFVRQSAALEKANNINDKLISLKEANDNLENLRQTFSSFQKRTEQDFESLNALQRDYEHAQNLFFQGQAGLLATQLQAGQPCPVCGSVDHPHPAEKSQSVPSEDRLKSLREQVKKATDTHEKSKGAWDRVNADGHAQKQIVTRLQTELDAIIQDDIVNLEKEKLTKWISGKTSDIQQQIKSLNNLLEQLSTKKRREPILIKEIDSRNLLIAGLEKTIDDLQTGHTTLFARVQSAKGILEKLEAEVPAEIRSQQALAVVIQNIKFRYQEMKEALERTEKNYRNGQVNYAKATTEREGAEKSFMEAEQELSAAQKRFLTALISAGFSGEEAYVNAKLPETEMTYLEKEIAVYQEELRSARDNYLKAQKEIEGLSLVDTSPSEQELYNIQDTKNKYIQQRTEIFARQKHNRAMLDGISELAAKSQKIEEQYSVVGDLANVAKGNNSQRISFERYVLAAFFNDIIVAANLRLSTMTAGRYQMNRITVKGKGSAQSGLELEVVDYYTGRARHVKTLSGGEGFKASLALALGLADVVQSYAGGISLDTMFVDEGFGTLDPESLDSAIDCLVDLQHSGRLVGIISHVPELKDNIDARLEIEAGKDGSQANFIIA